jgi:FRG domain
MKHKDKKISSVSNLLNALLGAYTPGETVWFRGQVNKDWTLTPSICRHPNGIDAEIMLLKRFMQNAMPYVEHKRPKAEWEWLFLMRVRPVNPTFKAVRRCAIMFGAPS